MCTVSDLVTKGDDLSLVDFEGLGGGIQRETVCPIAAQSDLTVGGVDGARTRHSSHICRIRSGTHEITINRQAPFACVVIDQLRVGLIIVQVVPAVGDNIASNWCRLIFGTSYFIIEGEDFLGVTNSAWVKDTIRNGAVVTKGVVGKDDLHTYDGIGIVSVIYKDSTVTDPITVLIGLSGKVIPTTRGYRLSI